MELVINKKKKQKKSIQQIPQISLIPKQNPQFNYDIILNKLLKYNHNDSKCSNCYYKSWYFVENNNLYCLKYKNLFELNIQDMYIEILNNNLVPITFNVKNEDEIEKYIILIQKANEMYNKSLFLIEKINNYINKKNLNFQYADIIGLNINSLFKLTINIYSYKITLFVYKDNKTSIITEESLFKFLEKNKKLINKTIEKNNIQYKNKQDIIHSPNTHQNYDPKNWNKRRNSMFIHYSKDKIYEIQACKKLPIKPYQWEIDDKEFEINI